MIKYFIPIILILSTAAFAEQNYDFSSLNQKEETNFHPYLSWGVGSIKIGIQGGIFHQSDHHGFDLRIGAGTILFAHGVGAHLNYLRFPEIWGNRNYYFGAGAGVCYQDAVLSDPGKNGIFAGPNLMLGRKVVNERGKICIQDINLLFPIDRKNGYWVIPTVSVGWLF